MDRNVQYGTREEAALFCLGQPAHALQPDEVICQTCKTLAAGAMLGIYQVRRHLGTGRSGQAYLAIHQRSGQPVVIKLFAPDPASVDLWEAARREVRSLTALRQPAILPVFSCTPWQAERPGMTPVPESLTAPPGKETYLLTLCQYVPGTLTHLIAHYQKRETQRAFRERGIVPLTRLLLLIQQIGTALSAAHMRGITHGAIHPENILIDGQEHLWIADFGLAKLHPPSVPYLAPELYSVVSTCTQMGSVAPYWQAVNPLSDQYMLATLCQQLFSQVLQPVDYEHLLPVLHRATQQKAERRYPNIDLFIQELTLQTGKKPTSGVYTGGLAASITGPNTGALYKPHNTSASNYQYSTPITPVMPSMLTPDGSQAQDWEKRGDKLFTMRDYPNALRAYHRAIEINAEKASVWLALGDTYLALEKFREALMAYEQAMYLNPDDPLAWSNRGTALDALGRHKEAMESYERAEQLR